MILDRHLEFGPKALRPALCRILRRKPTQDFCASVPMSTKGLKAIGLARGLRSAEANGPFLGARGAKVDTSLLPNVDSIANFKNARFSAIRWSGVKVTVDNVV